VGGSDELEWRCQENIAGNRSIFRDETLDMDRLRDVINSAILAARQYKKLTGKPLGITGEVGEFLAAELLGWQLTNARQPGYDAVDSGHRRIQIKARCISNNMNPGQRLGAIKFDHEWDCVALIILDEDYNPVSIHEASRNAVETALKEPGSKARNERGALGVIKFKRISCCIWTNQENKPFGNPDANSNSPDSIHRVS
jgi:hypothetical protein